MYNGGMARRLGYALSPPPPLPGNETPSLSTGLLTLEDLRTVTSRGGVCGVTCGFRTCRCGENARACGFRDCVPGLKNGCSWGRTGIFGDGNSSVVSASEVLGMSARGITDGVEGVVGLDNVLESAPDRFVPELIGIYRDG